MYDIETYNRPSVAVDTVVFGVKTIKADKNNTVDKKQLQLLLVRRKENPYKGKLSLPGGFLHEGETVEQSALRTLNEKTGLVNPKLIPLGVYSEPHRDERGWIISSANIALTHTVDIHSSKGSTAMDAQWYDFKYNRAENKVTLSNGSNVIQISDNTLDCQDIAFDHYKIIWDGFTRLIDEVLNHDIVFDLMTERFTMSELQQVYEAILGTKLTAPNFRRKMLNKVEPTAYYDKVAAHRTSKLYTRKR